MKKLGFVALFFISFAFVLSAQVLNDAESFTVSASVGKFVDIKTLTDITFGDITSYVGGTDDVTDSKTVEIRANTAWTITAAAINKKLTRHETVDGYITGAGYEIPYSFVFDGTELIAAGNLVNSGIKSYTDKTTGYDEFTYSVTLAAANLTTDLDSGYYDDVITLTVAAQ